MQLKGLQIGILGGGRSGKASAMLCLHLGADDITLYDEHSLNGLLIDGVRMRDKATNEDASRAEFDLLIISPGVDSSGSFASAFTDRSMEVIGELEFAWRLYRGKVIAITGTNGKTTTTELIDGVIKSGGYSCVACGNHGMPLSEVLLLEEVPECVALEVSSFQLETISKFRPDIAVWLNFSEDHMDRYSKLDDYYQAKLRIFENMQEMDQVVIQSSEDVEVGSLSRTTFSSFEEGADYYYKEAGLYNKEVKYLDFGDTKLRGLHNAENVLASMAVGDIMGIDKGCFIRSICEYIPAPHRCELVGEIDGVEYINDSKATNLHALESALSSLGENIILLVGGKDKGSQFDHLRTLLGKKTKAVITFGEMGATLENLFSAIVNTHLVNTLDEAVGYAKTLARPGDIVLLSPGTSSYDQFKSYEERGNFFRSCVAELS